MAKNSFLIVTSLSKILVMLVIFMILLPYADKYKGMQKMVPKRDNVYEKSQISKVPYQNYEYAESQDFEWTVEKVDDHITKIRVPADARMSTPEELFTAMNNYRSARGVSQLQRSELLCQIAQNRANEQLANGDLDGHKGFDKYAEEQEEFNRVGEVLYGGGQPQLGVHIVEFGWDRSLTGHKEAIQNPVWQFGCGGIAGYYAVFIFGAK